MKCKICKKNIGKELKEPIQVQINGELVTKYIHREVCSSPET